MTLPSLWSHLVTGQFHFGLSITNHLLYLNCRHLHSLVPNNYSLLLRPLTFQHRYWYHFDLEPISDVFISTLPIPPRSTFINKMFFRTIIFNLCSRRINYRTRLITEPDQTMSFFSNSDFFPPTTLPICPPQFNSVSLRLTPFVYLV